MQGLTPFLSLLGVLIGAGLTFLASFYRESVQWRRSEIARLSESRRSAYADYAQAVKLDEVTCRRIAAHTGNYDAGGKLSVEDGLAQLSKNLSDRNAFYETLLLVGSVNAVAAAREWNEAVAALRRFIRDEPGSRNTPFPELYTWALITRDRFYAAARRDLHVEGVVARSDEDELSP
jgi:hypothetical protein